MILSLKVCLILETRVYARLDKDSRVSWSITRSTQSGTTSQATSRTTDSLIAATTRRTISSMVADDNSCRDGASLAGCSEKVASVALASMPRLGCSEVTEERENPVSASSN